MIDFVSNAAMLALCGIGFVKNEAADNPQS
jgi:hypothetical protein